MGHYLRVALHLLRASVAAQAQYRLDFLLQLGMAGFWVTWNVAPVLIIFQLRDSLGGWSRPQAMLVMSVFLILRALIEGLVGPNLNALVWHIRGGTFDFMLLKPIDTQLLVSVNKVVPSKLIELSAGVALAVHSLLGLSPRPDLPALAAGTVMLGAGAMTIYAIWLLISCIAFWFVKVDNLTFLFGSVFDAARWPISVFKGWLRVVLTFVLPVAIMTSYPAMALLGQLELSSALYALSLCAALLLVSRRVWRWALTHYASASS